MPGDTPQDNGLDEGAAPPVQYVPYSTVWWEMLCRFGQIVLSRLAAAGSLQGFKEQNSDDFDVKGSTALNTIGVWGIGLGAALIAVHVLGAGTVAINSALLIGVMV